MMACSIVCFSLGQYYPQTMGSYYMWHYCRREWRREMTRCAQLGGHLTNQCFSSDGWTYEDEQQVGKRILSSDESKRQNTKGGQSRERKSLGKSFIQDILSVSLLSSSRTYSLLIAELGLKSSSSSNFFLLECFFLPTSWSSSIVVASSRESDDDVKEFR